MVKTQKKLLVFLVVIVVIILFTSTFLYYTDKKESMNKQHYIGNTFTAMEGLPYANKSAHSWSDDAELYLIESAEGIYTKEDVKYFKIDVTKDINGDGKCILWFYEYFSMSRNKTFRVTVVGDGTVMSSEKDFMNNFLSIRNWNIDSDISMQKIKDYTDISEYTKQNSSSVILYELMFAESLGSIPRWIVGLSRLGHNSSEIGVNAQTGDVFEPGKFVRIIKAVGEVAQSGVDKGNITNISLSIKLGTNIPQFKLTGGFLMVRTENTTNDIVQNLIFANSSSSIDSKHCYVYDENDNISASDPENDYDAHSSPPRYFLGENATLVVKIFLGHPYLNSSLPPDSGLDIVFISGYGPSYRIRITTPNNYGAARFIDLTP